MTHRGIRALLLGIAVGAAALTGSARADLVLDFDNAVFDSGSYLYTYNLYLSTETALVAGGLGDNSVNGNILTVYDFNGLIGGSVDTTGLDGVWSVTEQATGIDPVTQSPISDSASIMNFTLYFEGPADIVNPSVLNALPLGSFTVRSTFPVSSVVNLEFTGATQDTDDFTAIKNNYGQDFGPVVPEPASLATAGLGAVALLLAARRRRGA